MDGSRTHRGSQSDPPQVLKTRKSTGTYPLPIPSIPDGEAGCKGIFLVNKNIIKTLALFEYFVILKFCRLEYRIIIL